MHSLDIGAQVIDAATGEPKWSTPATDTCAGRKDCNPGISQAITAIPGIVFAGHMDGRLRAYSGTTGEVVWERQTDTPVETLSGEVAHGGSFGGGAGPMAHSARFRRCTPQSVISPPA